MNKDKGTKIQLESNKPGHEPVFSEPVGGPAWVRIPVTLIGYFLMLMLFAKILGVIFSWLGS